MSKELINELSRLQLLSSRCKNKMSMCPLSITLEENRAYLIFNYIKELKEEINKISKKELKVRDMLYSIENGTLTRERLIQIEEVLFEFGDSNE